MLGAFDAVFLGVGLGRTAALAIEGETLDGVWEALDFIFQTHTRPFAECVVGTHVLVIGAGNTAIDVATAAKRLGAETVTIAYRRSESLIPAFPYEYDLARADGVRFEWFAQPIRVSAREARAGVEFLRTELEDPASRNGRVRAAARLELRPSGRHGGQGARAGAAAGPGRRPARPEMRTGRSVSIRPPAPPASPGLFAGGDCLRGGGEVVDAVQDGKVAARGHALPRS